MLELGFEVGCEPIGKFFPRRAPEPLRLRTQRSFSLELTIMADMEAENVPIPVKVVPETLLKKRKRNEQWAINRKEQLESSKAKNAKNHGVVFKRAEEFIKQYRGQVIWSEISGALNSRWYPVAKTSAEWISRVYLGFCL